MTPPKDSLPTDDQRRLLCDMIAAAFIEIRQLGREGKALQAADLADAFHEVSREMYGWGGWNRSIFRESLHDYQHKYHGEDYFGKRDYMKMFDDIFGPPVTSERMIS